MSKSQKILTKLEELAIPHQDFTHPAVYTCEESQQLCPPMPGKKNKNLFLRDRKGKKYFLISLAQDKQVNLKQLSNTLGVNGLSFASEERLMKVLGVEPGSVGLLTLVNDTERLSSVYVDQELLDEEWFQSHPAINTSTIAFKTSGISTLLSHTGHTWTSLNL